MIKTLAFFLIQAFLLIAFVSGQGKGGKASLINTDHLDRLYEEGAANGQTIGYVYIYSEYPDYAFTPAPGEGIACVDDAARAAIFYLRHYQVAKRGNSLKKARRLLEFIMAMQAKNGLFYNFILNDLTINKNYQRSKAIRDWWSWRALWALGEGAAFYKEREPALSSRMLSAFKRSLPHMSVYTEQYDSVSTYKGITLPQWLPQSFAADQAATLMKGLLHYHNLTQDSAAERLIRVLGEGIIRMQAGNEEQLPHYAFLSWRNQWHAWGNSQATALLLAGEALNYKPFIEASVKELQYFHSYLRRENFLKSFALQREETHLKTTDIQKFEQIAYGIRPLVFANIQAYRLLKEERYARQAISIASWLFGNNPSGKLMYDPKSGRCYDGINKPNDINKNAGAESTIEALLILLELENTPETKEWLHESYQNLTCRE